jgi:selenocysteine lyase/cysteine desulfurase
VQHKPLDVAKFRALFPSMSTRPINFAAMALASMPAEVKIAVDKHRAELDHAPYQTQLDQLHRQEGEVCQAVSDYFAVPKDNIALTTGTTLGLSLLYAGLQIRPDQEILTTEHEFSRTLTTLDWRRERDGVRNRRLKLMPNPAAVTKDTLLKELSSAVCSHTRVVALQWVYSSTGVKLPLAEIADWLNSKVNPGRAPEDRILLCIDGVHGFGVEDATFRQLGCDFFVSGCHKWAFGPRGTGIWCGASDAWLQYRQLVPTSSNDKKIGLRNSPGGVQAYEHIWALEEAFRLLIKEKARIAKHVHGLTTDFKRELAKIRGISIITPMSVDYSAGIVCFDIEGLGTAQAVDKLLEKDIRASISSGDAGRPPDLRHVRVSIAAFNTAAEVDECLRAVALLAPYRPSRASSKAPRTKQTRNRPRARR